MPTYRVEASTVVVQWVEATNAKEAIEQAVENGDDWELDAEVEIGEDDVTSAAVQRGE